MPDWIGQTLSKVEIQRLLGRGGMADVYLGRHTTLNRPVAVKILHAHLSDNESLLGRFRAEAQAVGNLRHPHIVQVLDFDIVDDRPYIVMELLEGVSLKHYLRDVRKLGRRLAPDAVARLINALAGALDYAHTRGIVHRDVKPANVMLRREGGILDPAAPFPKDAEPVLTDFGVARMADATFQTASGVIIGTPAYMSPEQVRGDVVDPRSDIYSLGIMLYEMLAGVLPFDGDTQASILIKHISEPPPQMPGASAELQAVVDRALAKDASVRFQTASDLAAALGAALRKGGADGITEPGVPAREVPSTPEPDATRNLRPTPESSTPTPTALGTQEMPAQRTSPALWIVGAIGALALIVSIISLTGMLNNRDNPDGREVGLQGGSSPTPPLEVSETPDAPAETSPSTTSTAGPTDEPGGATTGSDLDQPVGQVLLRDMEAAVSLSNLPAQPDGSVYEAWLTEPDRQPLSLGVAEIAGDELSLVYTAPNAANLINEYSGFALSVEPASDPDPAMSGDPIYVGQVSPESLSRLRLMFDAARGASLEQAVLEGLPQQALVYDSHLDNTINAIAAGDLAMSQTHAEHVINIVVGRNSEEYLDYNANGRPENPGDGVGLATYLAILQETALAGANTPGAPADSQEVAGEIGEQVDDILLTIMDAKNDELSITAADSIEEITVLADDLSPLHVQEAVATLVEASDPLDLAVAVQVFPAAP